MKEEMFCDDLDELFDVAHKDALIMLKNEEDRDLLLSQREDRSQSSMAGVDMDHSKSLEKKKKRAEEEDGKLLPDIAAARSGLEKAERILILASGDGVEFLLGVPKIRSSSETDQASLSAINDWDLSQQIKAFVFYTTASNTGAFHHVRWMGKGLYCIKIFLFQDLFSLPECELRALRDISLFTALCYVPFWNESPIGPCAAKNDMDMMILMQQGISNEKLAKVAFTAFKRHLWYISEEAVGLSLFDDRISTDERRKMVNNMSRPEKPKGLKKVDGKSFLPQTSLSEFFLQ
ncbi:hypothetical protein O3P69_009253 [Scylla paramamosain]|uniref:Uncharacterized protein n=1 Tax=Scylla paramamosain TaxID=85552 RepID=A0AAW0TC54_SCYPA